MKNYLTVVGFLLLIHFMHAQDSWKITLNKKMVLISSESNELRNIKKISSADWKKNGYLEVRYKESNPSTWLHSLQFTDEQGNPLLVKDSTMTAKIPIAALRKIFAGKKKLKIFMVINPPNPMMAAPSRMIHLVTLRLP